MTTTTTNEIYLIDYGYTSGTLDLDDSEGYLIDESVNEFGRVLQVALGVHFPDATVRVRQVPRGEGCLTVHTHKPGSMEVVIYSTDDGDGDRPELLEVQEVIDAVWNAMEWMVEAPYAYKVTEGARFVSLSGWATFEVWVSAEDFTEWFGGCPRDTLFRLDGQNGRGTEREWRRALRRIADAHVRELAEHGRMVSVSREELGQVSTLEQLARLFEDAAPKEGR